jgi:hypothetical protein
MEQIFAILLGFFTGYLIVRTLKSNKTPTEVCTHHKWEYRDRGDGVEALFCSVCKRWAGMGE